MNWKFVPLAMLIAGCTGDTTNPDESDSDSGNPIVESEDSKPNGWGDDTEEPGDTEDIDTGPGSSESEETSDSEDSWPDFGSHSLVDTYPDTGDCPWGEVTDCDGNCYPSALVGDGVCDDGTISANFDCDAWFADYGDCTPDDSAMSTDVCRYRVHLRAEWPASDYGFDIVSVSNGGTIINQPTGSLTTNYQDYYWSIAMGSGDILVTSRDASSNGWGSGYIEIIDPDTNAVVYFASVPNKTAKLTELATIDCNPSGGPGDDSAPDSDWIIDTQTNDTAPEACGIRVEINTAIYGNEVSWTLEDNLGNLIADGGPYANNSTYFHEVDQPQGQMLTFTARDSWGDGWHGGSYRVTDIPMGTEYAFGAPLSGSVWTHTFPNRCHEDVPPEPPVQEEPPEGHTGSGCFPGTIEDCNGICWPEEFYGDGFCDDGTLSAVDFDCPELFGDDGDCGGCGAGEVEDCFGGCTPDSWLGDAWCDSALDCAVHNFDDGDCGP